MESRLAGIKGVMPYFDDVLIVVESAYRLGVDLRSVLKRFKEDGLRLRSNKCEFFVCQVVKISSYLITKYGKSPTKEKVKDIQEAPSPTLKLELQTFLGMLNFFHVFLENKPTVAEPLHKSLHEDISWKWMTEEQDAFDRLKIMLSSLENLAHYDEKKALVLTCDASPYGVGAVLSHLDECGKEVPIAFHSRTLLSSERRFAQLDREALALIVGVKKFHNYIYGRNCEIRPDHKPLLEIFGNHKSIPEVIPPRMLRWILILLSYDYKHARIALCHPACNKRAERVVQTTKHFFKMLKDGYIKTKLARFLMQQHSSPILTTGNSPAEILINRKLQTRLSSLHPKFFETANKQTLEKDAPEVLRQFWAKDPVFARNYGNGPKWSPAFIQKSVGPVSYR
ncbi:hypothetical protein JTB14_036939 [Gonioctena quinquepunctata]|nr:hypothetical protein JTB14_036939 [Gonioctena quinquepunctata]